jgi:hypothetical protein
MEWPEVVPRAQDAQPLPVDDDPSEVDWLEIEDESEEASRLAGKKAEDPASKHRRVIADWPEDEEEEVEEVSGIIASSRRERLARRQELTEPLQTTEPPPRPPQPQVQAAEILRPAAAVRSDVAKPVPTTGAGAEKGAGPEKTKKSRFATVFRATNL